MMRKASAVYSAPPRESVTHSSGGRSNNGPKTSYVVSGMSRGSRPGFSESKSGNPFPGASEANPREVSTERSRRCSGAAAEYRQGAENSAAPLRCPLSTNTDPGVSPMYQNENMNRPSLMMRNGIRENGVLDEYFEPINSTAAACGKAPSRVVSSSFTPRPADANRDNRVPASFFPHKAPASAVPAPGFGSNNVQGHTERNRAQSASNAFGRACAAPLKERNANSANVYLPSNRNPEMRPQPPQPPSPQPPQPVQETENNQYGNHFSQNATAMEPKEPSWMKSDGVWNGEGAYSTGSTPQSTMPQCTAGFTVQNSVVINNRSGVAGEHRDRRMDPNVRYSPNATFTKDMNVQVGTDVNFTTSTPLPVDFSNRRSDDLSSNNDGTRYWTPSEGFRETGANANCFRNDNRSLGSAQSVVLESPETNDVGVLAGRVLRAAARTGESMGSVERPANGSFEFRYDCIQKPASPVLPAEFRGYGGNSSFEVPQGCQRHTPCVSPFTPPLREKFWTPVQEVPDPEHLECGRCSCNEEARRRWMWMAHQALEMAAATSGKCAGCRDRKGRGFLDTFG